MLATISLVLLSAIPILAGIFRLRELAGGAEITPDNARFFTAPAPVVLHIVGAIIYAVLGATQFSPAIRRRRPGWHRRLGWVLTACGLVVAFSGLWMTVFYALPTQDGTLLNMFRLFFGTGMAVSIVLGVVADRQRRMAAHGAWMTRAYAIGVGAGTQALVLAITEIIAGPPSVTGRALLMGLAWVINLAVAERAIRRRGQRDNRGSIRQALPAS